MSCAAGLIRYQELEAVLLSGKVIEIVHNYVELSSDYIPTMCAMIVHVEALTRLLYCYSGIVCCS